MEPRWIILRSFQPLSLSRVIHISMTNGIGRKTATNLRQERKVGDEFRLMSTGTIPIFFLEITDLKTLKVRLLSWLATLGRRCLRDGDDCAAGSGSVATVVLGDVVGDTKMNTAENSIEAKESPVWVGFAIGAAHGGRCRNEI